MSYKRNVGLLYLFNFLKNLHFFGALAVPFYLHRAGLDYKGMFILEAVFSFCIILFEIPIGIVANRYSRKYSLFFGSVFFASGFFIFGFTTSYLLLLMAEIICACGMSLLNGADRTILFEILQNAQQEKKAPVVAARFDAFGNAGMFIAFPAGTLFDGSGVVPYRTEPHWALCSQQRLS